MLRFALGLATAVALTGCATSRVSLYPDADGAKGSVAVMDPASEVEQGALTQPNTWANMGGKTVTARPLKRLHTKLMAYMPPPPRIYMLYFVEGTTELTPGSGPTMEALRQAVDANADVQITGHTDTVGTPERNDELSRERAIEVRDALVAQGLPVKNARVTGRGERQLRIETGDEVDEPGNRRVEVILR